MEADTSGLDLLADAYLSAASLVDTDLAAVAGAEMPRLAYSVREDIVEATPVSKPHPFYPDEVPGALRRSTTVERDIAVRGTEVTATLVAEQERLAHANQDGTGGGYSVMEYILHGRGAITAPSFGPHSTGKLALLTPMGPRRSVGPAEPAASPMGMRPYIEQAYPPIVTASTLFAHRWGERALDTVMERTNLAELR